MLGRQRITSRRETAEGNHKVRMEQEEEEEEEEEEWEASPLDHCRIYFVSANGPSQCATRYDCN